MVIVVALGIALTTMERSPLKTGDENSDSPMADVPLKTYVNQLHKYSFQYPENVQVLAPGEDTDQSEVQVGYGEKGSNSVVGIRTYANAAGIYQFNQNAPNLADYVKALAAEGKYFRTYYPIQFAGTEAFEATGVLPALDAPPYESGFVWAEIDGKLYELYFPIYRDTATKYKGWHNKLTPEQAVIFSSFSPISE